MQENRINSQTQFLRKQNPRLEEIGFVTITFELGKLLNYYFSIQSSLSQSSFNFFPTFEHLKRLYNLYILFPLDNLT